MYPDESRGFLPRAALLAAALIWGSSFIIVKNTVDAVPPNFLLAVRFTFGALALGLIFHKHFRKIDRGCFWRGAVMGAFLFLAYCFQTLGIQYTTPGKNAFLTAVYCILVPFVYWAVDGSRLSAVNFAAAVLCLAGIGLVSLQGDFTVSSGDLLTLIGGVFYALHMVTVAKVSRGRDLFVLTAVQFAAGALLAWGTFLLFEPLPGRISWETGGGMAYLAVFCTAGALLFQNIGQKYTPPAQASLILSLESVFGVGFSVILGAETLTGKMIMGFILIFAAVIMNEIWPGLHLKQKNRAH